MNEHRGEIAMLLTRLGRHTSFSVPVWATLLGDIEAEGYVVIPAAALAEPSVATVAAYERGRQDALAEREALDARLRAAGDALATLVISHITPGDCFQRDERLVEWWAAIAKTPETPEAESWTPPDFGNDVWRP